MYVIVCALSPVISFRDPGAANVSQSLRMTASKTHFATLCEAVIVSPLALTAAVSQTHHPNHQQHEN